MRFFEFAILVVAAVTGANALSCEELGAPNPVVCTSDSKCPPGYRGIWEFECPGGGLCCIHP